MNSWNGTLGGYGGQASLQEDFYLTAKCCYFVSTYLTLTGSDFRRVGAVEEKASTFFLSLRTTSILK